MAHIGVGKLYEAFKNWGQDITEEYKIGKAEQMFAQEKAVEVRFGIIYHMIRIINLVQGGFVNFQGTRVDHMRDEIGEDEENQFIGI